MGIQDPQVIVACDECGNEESFGLTPLAGRGWDDRNLNANMKSQGWEERAGRVLCEGCCGKAAPVTTRRKR